MASTREIILEWVCPALGVIISNCMYAAPVRDVKAAINKGDLGDLNPTPWAFMTGNNLAGVLYGALLTNYWIFFSVAPGLLVSLWLNISASKLLYQGYHMKEARDSMTAFLLKSHSFGLRDSNQDDTSSKDLAAATSIICKITSDVPPAPFHHEKLFMTICIAHMVVIILLIFLDAMDSDSKISMVGWWVNCNMVFFYAGPLSTMLKVLKSKNSATIHVPTMILNTLCSTFWLAYAIAIYDWFLIVPNGLGTAFGAIQGFLCLIFPRSPKGNIAANESSSGGTEIQSA